MNLIIIFLQYCLLLCASELKEGMFTVKKCKRSKRNHMFECKQQQNLRLKFCKRRFHVRGVSIGMNYCFCFRFRFWPIKLDFLKADSFVFKQDAEPLTSCYAKHFCFRYDCEMLYCKH